ncbi:hypothetical protein HMPREF0105_1765 [Bacteroides sp. 3_1_33FAA]|uniref:Uncharacterized protein n=1 Tax=Phocaeicola dorei DSM 17855 TaxID=483217 RepID=B6VSX5_9BACT|nr:hypothetical protein BACDOR_00376 [Phocaeicola dorei DSM 17855]EEZ22568.1 hypothetical protein HMPREF0105_1765 [Bacteroides sp. 3_1_33FAA]
MIYANIDEEGVLPMEFYSFTWNIVHLLSVLFSYTDNNLYSSCWICIGF